MYSRKQIVEENSYAHVTFRCLNREFLFEASAVKEFIILSWFRYFQRYGIKIFAFIVMDNHAHMVIQTPGPEELGHFMRTVNSQIARFVNKFYGRDSHALKERYKSPIISNDIYMRRTLQYVWLNRYKVDGKDPKTDPYCSLSWKMHPRIFGMVFQKYKKAENLKSLLTSLKKLPIPYTETYRELQDLLNEARSKIVSLTKEIFQNMHTIGDLVTVQYRSELLRASLREHIPWVPI